MDMENRIQRIEEILGDFVGESVSEAIRRLAAKEEEAEESRREQMIQMLRLVDKMNDLAADVRLLKLASTSTGGSSRIGPKVPEPKAFNGDRNAKTLENFLYDLDQYFQAAGVLEEDKVKYACMYLSDRAKVWWRSLQVNDEDAGRPGIKSWSEFQEALKERFMPTNTAFKAREALKNLRQTGGIQDYIKDYTSLMLEIEHMSEYDKFFNFMSGLQGWAQNELRRQGVKDLSAAIAAADGLVDFKAPGTSGLSKSRTDGKKDKGKKKEGHGDRKTNKFGNQRGNEEKGGSTSKYGQGCFICQGPHYARDCPKKERLNALTLEENHTQGEQVSRVNPLQLLNAISASPSKPVSKGLLYLEIKVNGRSAKALLDTGATHNFVRDSLAKEFGLRMESTVTQVKAINSEAQAVRGMITGVDVAVGAWKGKLNMMAIPLDDFDIILGLDFFLVTKATVMPYLRGIMIADESQPCFVHGVPSANGLGMEMLSAIQVSDGLRKGEPTFLATLMEPKEGILEGFPEEILEVLEEFENVMPPEVGLNRVQITFGLTGS